MADVRCEHLRCWPKRPIACDQGGKEARPEYHDIHSQVLEDVLTRLDRAFQAFFRRV
jgi:hypothetical protein